MVLADDGSNRWRSILQAGAADEREEEEDDEADQKPTTPTAPCRATTIAAIGIIVAALVHHVSYSLWL